MLLAVDDSDGNNNTVIAHNAPAATLQSEANESDVELEAETQKEAAEDGVAQDGAADFDAAAEKAVEVGGVWAAVEDEEEARSPPRPRARRRAAGKFLGPGTAAGPGPVPPRGSAGRPAAGESLGPGTAAAAAGAGRGGAARPVPGKSLAAAAATAAMRASAGPPAPGRSLAAAAAAAAVRGSAGGHPPAGGRGGGARKPFQRVFLRAPPKLPKADRRAMLRLRKELQISVQCGEQCAYPPVAAFEELGEVVPAYVLESLASHGIEAPMPIQAQALPVALCGHDVIGIAKTGSGKTLAYLLPAIVQIEAQEPLAKQAGTPIALVLVPVRELAVQIAEEARKLLQGSSAGRHPQGVKAACVYGGGSSNKGWQVDELRRGCHVLAATPGRLVDLISSDDVRLERVTYFVLDEADRMLECGFEDQVGSIASGIRPDRQTVFFSATWPESVQALAEKMCHCGAPPVLVSVGQQDQGGGPTTREGIVQEIVVFDQETWEQRDAAKQELLYNHLREVGSDPSFKALVFVSRKTLADELVNRLWKEGFRTDAMHGGRTQDKRLDVLDKFKKGETKLLVTTDVMGRGLDIPDISHVVCYDMGEVDDYVHRIGRTARGPYGQGHALTFFEYDWGWPMLASELIQVLEQAEQEVPIELRTIAQEVAAGKRKVKQDKKSAWSQGWG